MLKNFHELVKTQKANLFNKSSFLKIDRKLCSQERQYGFFMDQAVFLNSRDVLCWTTHSVRIGGILDLFFCPRTYTE